MANFRKFIALFLVLILLPVGGFLVFEGQVVSADTVAYGTTTVSLTVTGGITMACSSTADLGSLSGITGGTATVDANCHVVDSNATGYNVKIETATTTAPLLNSTLNSFPDYATTSPDLTFSISDSQAGIGFTIAPQTLTDADPAFYNDTTACDLGTAADGINCWRNVPANGTPVTVVNRPNSTDASGQDATLKLQAKIGAAYTQASGAYTGDIIITASENP